MAETVLSMAYTLANDCYAVKQIVAYVASYPSGMDDLKRNLARNLVKLMEVSADLKSQNALAKRSKVAQTTISNYMHPDSYTGAPSLDKVAKLARAYGLESWQLLHPTMGDKAITAEELALYRRLRETIKQAGNR